MLYHISVAHSELYGYGFRPYEYLPPPGSDNYTTAQTQGACVGNVQPQIMSPPQAVYTGGIHNGFSRIDWSSLDGKLCFLFSLLQNF